MNLAADFHGIVALNSHISQVYTAKKTRNFIDRHDSKLRARIKKKKLLFHNKVDSAPWELKLCFSMGMGLGGI